jgi:hypothetical protein
VAWLPDKALDLLDEACVRARIGRSTGRRIGWRGWSLPRAVAEVLGEWRAISVAALLETE